MVIVQADNFDACQLSQQLRERTKGQAGAMVSFLGYVRDYDENSATKSLFLEHYPGMCESEILAICQTATKRWDVADYLVVHRYGELAYTDQIVFVGVTSRHRTEAFRACEYIIDALKTRAPFWKRETLKDGQQFWVEQRQSDVDKTANWEAN